MSMKEIYGVIRKLGVTSNYKGYFYISDAIQLAMISQERPIRITKDIYPYLASKYKTTALNIEHNIRTVINVCWQTNKAGMTEIAGYPISCKPTNSDFIDMIAYYLLCEEETQGSSESFVSGSYLNRADGKNPPLPAAAE